MPAATTESILAHLRQAGVRVTKARRAVVEALAISVIGSDEHVTADTLHSAVARSHPEVNESSVYRTLDLLTEHGIVTHVHLGHGPAVYHLTSDVHAHLACECCGSVIELAAAETEHFVTDIEERHGFAVRLEHFAITGTCRRCRGGGASDG